MHKGHEVTGLGQYCAVINIHCAMSSKTLHEGQEVIGSGQYCAIIEFIVAWQARQCIRDERLQVQNSFLLQ